MKYRAKPIEVEAKQFDGSLMSGVEIEEWTKGKFMLNRTNGMTWLHDAEVGHRIDVGDLVALSPNGDFEAFTKTEFEVLFEPIPDTPKRGRPKAEVEE